MTDILTNVGTFMLGIVLAILIFPPILISLEECAIPMVQEKDISLPSFIAQPVGWVVAAVGHVIFSYLEWVEGFIKARCPYNEERED